MMTAMYEDALHDKGEGEWERESKAFNVRVGVAQSWFLACLSSCWRLCVENSGKVYLWN